MGVIQFDRQRVELRERGVVVGLLPSPAELDLDCVAVSLGEMVENVALSLKD